MKAPRDPQHPPSPEPTEEELVSWEELRTAVAGQTAVAPSPSVERELLARVRVHEAQRLVPPPTWETWAWGIAIALLVAALLWGLLKPGVVLEWSVEEGAVTSFEIHRADVKTRDFTLYERFEVERPAELYRYVDALVWPGRTYVYRIKALIGETAVSGQEIIVRGSLALPGQLSVLLTGAMLGYAAIILMQQRRYRV